MTRLLEAAAAAAPPVVLLEDVHWADDMSLRILAFAARHLVARPVLVAVTARAGGAGRRAVAPADARRAGGGARLAGWRSAPAGQSDTLALVRALLGAGRRGADATARRAGLGGEPGQSRSW